MNIIITENDIRPQDVFDEYLKLAEKDIKTYFGNAAFYKINCPACGGESRFAMEKKGFIYDKCDNCETLFVNPRPAKEAFDNYYKDSPSTEFWATKFYKITEEARREKLWKPKAALVKELLSINTNVDNPIKFIVDIGGGYGIFAEEFIKISDISPVIIEPSIHLAEICRKKGLVVIEKFIEDISSDELPVQHKCFVSFELFEHLHNPRFFLEKMFSIMKEGDIFIFTTLSSTGVDIQVLGRHSKSVSPPHHLNFFNPRSVSLLALDIGYSKVDVITPGKLDIDIMLNNKHLIKDSFWSSFLKYADASQRELMQEMIQKLGISSHMMALLVK